MRKFFTLLLFSEIACTIDTKYKNLDEAYGRNHIDRRKRYEEKPHTAYYLSIRSYT